jgi:hypothetical protein
MIAPGVLVTLSVLPEAAKLAPPLTTVGPLGLASAIELEAPNAAPTASATRLDRAG